MSKPTLLDKNGKAQTKEVRKMTPEERTKNAERIKQIVFRFYHRYPFFALLLERHQVIAHYGIPTAAVTSRGQLIYNPEFIESLDDNQRLFVFGHEILHSALRHLPRKGTRHAGLWNIACDYLVNDMMVKDLGHDKMPQGLIYDSQLDTGLTAEDLYEILAEKKGGKHAQNPGRGKALANKHKDMADRLDRNSPNPNDVQPDMLDHNTFPDGFDPADGEIVRGAGDAMPESEEEWKAAVAEAAASAKLQGKLPAHMDMAVQEFLQPKVTWVRQLVSHVSQETCKENMSDYTWTNPSRRFLSEDMIMPGLVGFRQRGASAVDTSGSMSAAWMQAVSDLENIRRRHGIEFYHMWCDAKVDAHGWMKPNEPFPKHAFGGGGTSFRPPFDHLKEKRFDKDIDFFVYFTDGYGDWPEKPPYKVIWVMFTDVEPPFGTVIRVKD